MQENYYTDAYVSCVIETHFRAKRPRIGEEIKGKLLHYINNHKEGYKLHRIDMDEGIAMEVELYFEKANCIPDLDELHSYFTWLRTDRKEGEMIREVAITLPIDEDAAEKYFPNGSYSYPPKEKTLTPSSTFTKK